MDYEVNRQNKRCKINSKPGMLSTCSFLSIYPMVKEGLVDPKSIIIDAKSEHQEQDVEQKVNNLFL